jgi:hypothetical protein
LALAEVSMVIIGTNAMVIMETLTTETAIHKITTVATTTTATVTTVKTIEDIKTAMDTRGTITPTEIPTDK